MSRSPKRPRFAPLLCLLALSGAELSPVLHAGPQPDAGGEIGLGDLIAYALKNDLDLIAKRGEISIAEARKRAERDWPDPQIRFRKTWGYNDVPPPYYDRREEDYIQRTTRTEVNEDGEVKESTAIERVRRTTDRKVTPGRDKTVIEEKVRERSGENITVAPNAETFDPGGRATDNQSFYRSGTEVRDHAFDPFASEEDLALQFRIYVPHPGIRRARLLRAQREIDLARARALAAERAVVMKVREDYEELQYLQAQIKLLENEDAAAKIYQDAQDELLAEGLMTIDRLEFVRRNPLAAEAARLEFEAKRNRLASRLGIRDASRIRVTDKLVSPGLALDYTHLEYLIRMAFAHRGDLAAIRGRGQIAEAELKEAKAKNIPWFEYFQAEFGSDEQGGNRTGTSWGIQMAMSLPIFTWFGHEREIHEAAVASYFAQMGAGKEIISAQVAAAYQNIKRSAAHREKARAHSAAQAKRTGEFLERIKGMDRRGYEEARYDIARSTAAIDELRLNAESTYNRALLELEEAVGASLEQIFAGGKAVTEVSESAAPFTARPEMGAPERVSSEKIEAAAAAGRVPLIGAAPHEEIEKPKKRKGFLSRLGNGDGPKQRAFGRSGPRR